MNTPERGDFPVFDSHNLTGRSRDAYGHQDVTADLAAQAAKDAAAGAILTDPSYRDAVGYLTHVLGCTPYAAAVIISRRPVA
jgi:hypothetical protein